MPGGGVAPSASQEEEAGKSLESSEFWDSKGYTVRSCLGVEVELPSVARRTQGWEGGLQSTL